MVDIGLQGGPIKTAHFLRYHKLFLQLLCYNRYNHALFAEVFRIYSRKQQATIFLKEC